MPSGRGGRARALLPSSSSSSSASSTSSSSSAMGTSMAMAGTAMARTAPAASDVVVPELRNFFRSGNGTSSISSSWSTLMATFAAHLASLAASRPAACGLRASSSLSPKLDTLDSPHPQQSSSSRRLLGTRRTMAISALF